MSKLDEIIEQYSDDEFLTADGFDDAIIGVAYDKPTGNNRIVYSRTKCIEVLMKQDGMSFDEAEEYFDFNVEGAYVGERTPIWVDDEMFE